jgi:hypothetical protein
MLWQHRTILSMRCNVRLIDFRLRSSSSCLVLGPSTFPFSLPSALSPLPSPQIQTCSSLSSVGAFCPSLSLPLEFLIRSLDPQAKPALSSAFSTTSERCCLHLSESLLSLLPAHHQASSALIPSAALSLPLRFDTKVPHTVGAAFGTKNVVSTLRPLRCCWFWQLCCHRGRGRR